MHPGRSGARPGLPDWIVRGRTRCYGLERPRQRREYDKKTPRNGASEAERSTALAPGLDRPGLNLVPRDGASEAAERIRHKDAPDWSIRGGMKHGPRGAPGAADWNIRGRNAPGLELPGTKRPGNGRSRTANKEKETAAERQGEENKNKSKERKGEDKRERRREAGGERARCGKREEKEKNGRRTGTWSLDRDRLERRRHGGGKERQEQGEEVREDKEDKSQGERGEGEAERAD